MGRRGPKRHPTAKRERNGRIDRHGAAERHMEGLDRDERETLAVALDARTRLHGIEPRHSRDQKAGSAIGRFCLKGQITQAQYDAAMLFLEGYNRHLRAVDAPQPQPGAVNLNAVHGRPVAVEDEAQLAKWQKEHKNALDAIFAKQYEIGLSGNLYGSLYAVLVRDVELDMLLGDVRLATNALAKHYKLAERMAA